MAWAGQFDDFSTNAAPSFPMGPGGDQPDTGGNMTIGALTPGISSTKIVGIIIAKEEPRSFPSKKDPSTERHVLSFTIRDSPQDFVNVSCWGSEEFIKTTANQYHIGDVVEIGHAAIQSKPLDGSDEKFRPWTPSMYQLTVSETKSSIKLFSGIGLGNFAALLHVPVKANNDYYTIDDVLTNGQALHGEFISLLAAVKSVGQVRNLKSKMGKNLRRCEVKLFDETANNFALVLWDEELISLAQGWTPRDNVIFAADVKVTFDDYRKTMISTATTKTIITVNPDTREAHNLYRYAQTVDITSQDFESGNDFSKIVDLENIHDVYSIEQIKEKQQEAISKGAGGTEYGIVFCFISDLNIDGNMDSIVVTRCSKCRQRMDRVTNACNNQNCPQGSVASIGGSMPESETSFNILMSLSDQTGTLTGCNLSGQVAERLLECTVQDFLVLSEHQRTDMKWSILLEKCKLYLKISLPSLDRPRGAVNILQCTKADLEEAVKFMQ